MGKHFTKITLLIFCIFGSIGLGAQALTGTKTVGGTTPDYASLSLAIDALNANGVGSGGVVFAVAAGHTELIVNKTITTASSSAADPIVFVKTGAGANPLLIAGVGTSTTTDGIIKIAGTDFIAFDGIDLKDTITTSATSQMEWGYAIVKGSATNGAQNVNIRNCNIMLARSNVNSRGIYVGNHTSTVTTALTITTTAGMHSNLNFYGNTISNCYTAIYTTGPTNALYYDDSLTIEMNTITSFGGTTTVAYGIYLQNFKNAAVLRDSINDSISLTAAFVLYGIYTGNASNSNVSIKNNIVTLPITSTNSNRQTFPIYCSNGTYGNTVRIDSNRMYNCGFANISTNSYAIYTSGNADTYISNNSILGFTRSGTSGTAYYIYSGGTPVNRNINNNTISGNTAGVTSGTLYGISVPTGTANIYQNSISSNTSTGFSNYYIHVLGGGNIYQNTINNNAPSGTSKDFYLVYAVTSSDVNIYQNILSNNISSGTSSKMYNLYNFTTGAKAYIYSNQVFGNAHSGTSSQFYTLIIESDAADIYKNEIYNQANGYSFMVGIELSGTGTYNVYQNKIYGFSSTTVGCIVSGIRQSAQSTANIYNNLIGLLAAAPTSTATNGINGINVIDGLVTNIYYNSIMLNATSTGGTNCILLSSNTLATVANNVLVNTSANSTTLARSATAIRRLTTAYTTYTQASNNNFFYVGATPTANRNIYTDGTNTFTSISAYKTYALTRDQLSFAGNANFKSIVGTSVDFLKPDSTLPSLLESNGKIINGIVGDYQSNTSRSTYPLSGQVNGGGRMPDIGAYEMDLIPLDSIGPDITYEPLLKSLVGTSKVLSNVSITDPSGVNVSTGTLPRLYFKKSTHANSLAATNTSTSDGWKYVEATGITSPFEFTIDYSLLYGAGTVSVGDIIQYFVVAQDNAPANNVGSKGAVPASRPSSVSLLAAQYPVTIAQSYNIASPIPAVVTVGASGADYSSFTQATGLFNAINNNVLNQDVTVNVISDLLAENGAVALTKYSEEGGSGFSITVRPLFSTVYTIAGTSTPGGLIRLNDVQRFYIDGNYSGNGRYLTFVNKATSGNNAVIHLSSSGAGCKNIKIMNCNIWSDSAGASGNTGIFIGGNNVNSGGGTSNSAGMDHRNIVIQNNTLSNVFTGILVNGYTGYPVDSLVISGNQVGTDSALKYIGGCGINLLRVNRVWCNGNRIFNIVNPNGGNVYGLSLGASVTNAEIAANNITNIRCTTTGSIPVFGIYATGAGINNILVKNNCISRIMGQGGASLIANGPVGIYLNAGTNYKILNNSVCLSNNRLSDAAGTYAACMFTAAGVSGINVSNNVFKNVMTSSNTSPGTNFCVYSNTPATAYMRMNNNLYYAASATTGMVNALGYGAGAIRSDLAAWRTATGKDLNSMWGEPGYVGDSIVTPNVNDSNSWLVNGRGYPFAEVPADFNGQPRSTTITAGASDIGAFEITPGVSPANAAATAAPAAASTTFYTVGQDTVAAISWASGSTVPFAFSLKYYSGLNPPSPTSPKHLNAYWNLDGSPSTGLDYTLKLYYKPEAMRTVENESALVMAKKELSMSWFPFLSGSTIVDSLNKTMSVTFLSNLAVFTGTSVNNPLPVSLLDFDAKIMDEQVILNWVTASEKNTLHFEIECGSDAGVYQNIGKVSAAGNSLTTARYQFADRLGMQLLKRSAQIFYRLKIIDRDGRFSYSPVVILQASPPTGNETTLVYPNPFTDKVFVKTPGSTGPLTVRLFDIQGKLLLTRAVFINNATGLIALDSLGALSNGIYFLEVESDHSKITVKVKKTEE